MIASIKTVAVYVSDQKEALRFYTEKLGFEVRRTESMGPDGTWVEVAPRGAVSRVVICPRTLMKDWECRRPSIMFGCEDTEATYRELSRRGVKFTQVPKRMPYGTFAQFVDLDGNEFVLTEGT
jgi:predicted enzyme related to lactoylglutathione lyase